VGESFGVGETTGVVAAVGDTTTRGRGEGVGVAEFTDSADAGMDEPAMNNAKTPVTAAVKRSVLSMRFIGRILLENANLQNCVSDFGLVLRILS